MEGFTYHNIFETKGIEYLVILGFFAILIPFWLVLNRRVEITRQIRKGIGVLKAGLFKVPQGVFHFGNHTWAHLEKSGVARVGLDDLLVRITGDISVSWLKHEGDNVMKDDPVAEIKHEGKTLAITSPLSGTFTGRNMEISKDPAVVTVDPYNEGWLLRIKPTAWIAETHDCHVAAEANSWLDSELERFRTFLATSLAKVSPESSKIVLQDGGELVENTLSELPGEVWKDFESEFLNGKKAALL
ncbi:MAG: glycine cleavage system protein H [Bacteroidales bacterium]